MPKTENKMPFCFFFLLTTGRIDSYDKAVILGLLRAKFSHFNSVLFFFNPPISRIIPFSQASGYNR
jgi:hypothetical protein